MSTTTTYYEVTFRTETVSEDLEDRIIEELDGFVGGHGNVTLVTVGGDFAECDGAYAARKLAQQLRDLGVDVHRIEPDLVTGPVIAKRCGATRQAVDAWIRGARLQGFPEPRSLVAGGVYRWEEVNHWLREQGKKHDENVRYLTATEELRADYTIVVQHAADVSTSPVASITSSVRPQLVPAMPTVTFPLTPLPDVTGQWVTLSQGAIAATQAAALASARARMRRTFTGNREIPA